MTHRQARRLAAVGKLRLAKTQALMTSLARDIPNESVRHQTLQIIGKYHQALGNLIDLSLALRDTKHEASPNKDWLEEDKDLGVVQED